MGLIVGMEITFDVLQSCAKTAFKATVRAGGLIRAKKGDWRGTEMAQSFSDCTAAICNGVVLLLL